MNKSTKNKRLGRGLAALMGEGFDEKISETISDGGRQLPIEFLRPSPNNPRSEFDDTSMEELANSIREKGLIQPILVRQINDRSDAYEIVAGERRWRAAQKAGIHSVPVLIKELNDSEALEIALIENIQRDNLNSIEEARAYERLRREYKYTQESLADVLGKSRSHVANTLRLLNLPQNVQEFVLRGELTAGHVRTLLTAPNPEELAKRILEEGLSVRGAENFARLEGGKPKQKKKNRSKKGKAPEKDADTIALEKNLADTLGLAVEIDHRGDKGGILKITYKTLEQLDDVCDRLSKTPQKNQPKNK